MAHDRVEAVERALSILEAFGQQRNRLTLAELAEETGLYKSTILRLAASLERFGYLTRDGDGKFRLGASLWRLGSSYRRSFAMDDQIRPTLRRLVEATKETVSYFVRDADQRLCLYRENSPNAARHHLEEGARLPLDRGAAGKVLQAYSPDREGPGRRVRNARHAVSVGERSPDLAAVAVPVFSINGEFRGALAVSGLKTRFGVKARAHALKCLIREGDALSKTLP